MEYLEESKEFCDAFVELSTDALLVADVEANIVSVSARAVKIFGYDNPEEMVGRSGFEYFVPEDRERAGANFQRRFLSEKIGYVDYTFVRKDGSRFWGQMDMAPYDDPDGHIKGVIGVVNDVTDLKTTYMSSSILRSG